MKNIFPLIVLLALLFLVIAGTVGVAATYSAPPQKVVRDFSISRKSVQALKDQVVLLVRLKKYREAERLLRRIIVRLPGNVMPELMLAKVYFLQKEYEKAQTFLERTKAAGAVSPLLLNNYGCVLAVQGFFESGIRVLLEAEKLSGGAGYICENLAVAFWLSGRLNAAQQYWQKTRLKGGNAVFSAPAEAIGLISAKPEEKE